MIGACCITQTCCTKGPECVTRPRVDSGSIAMPRQNPRSGPPPTVALAAGGSSKVSNSHGRNIDTFFTCVDIAVLQNRANGTAAPKMTASGPNTRRALNCARPRGSAHVPALCADLCACERVRLVRSARGVLSSCHVDCCASTSHCAQALHGERNSLAVGCLELTALFARVNDPGPPDGEASHRPGSTEPGNGLAAARARGCHDRPEAEGHS